MHRKLFCSINSYGINRVEEVLRDIAETGFRYIEISSEPARPLAFNPETLFRFSFRHDVALSNPSCSFSIPDIGDMIKSYGLVCTAMNACCELCHPKSVEVLRRRIEMADMLEIPIIITGIGHGWENEAYQKTALDNLKMICNYAKQFDINIGLKTDGVLTKSSKIAQNILLTLGDQNLKLDFDPANILVYNPQINMLHYLKGIISHIGYIHLREIDINVPIQAPLPLGGKINYQEIFNILDLYNFDGPCVLDLENTYLWKPNDTQIPLTYSYWQTKKYDQTNLEICHKRIQDSLDYLNTITKINF